MSDLPEEPLFTFSKKNYVAGKGKHLHPFPIIISLSEVLEYV